MLIKLGNSWINPDKVVAIRTPNMLTGEALHRIEVSIEGIDHPVVLKNDLARDDAFALCDTYANEILNSLQSYGITDE